MTRHALALPLRPPPAPRRPPHASTTPAAPPSRDPTVGSMHKTPRSAGPAASLPRSSLSDGRGAGGQKSASPRPSRPKNLAPPQAGGRLTRCGGQRSNARAATKLGGGVPRPRDGSRSVRVPPPPRNARLPTHQRAADSPSLAPPPPRSSEKCVRRCGRVLPKPSPNRAKCAPRARDASAKRRPGSIFLVREHETGSDGRTNTEMCLGVSNTRSPARTCKGPVRRPPRARLKRALARQPVMRRAEQNTACPLIGQIWRKRAPHAPPHPFLFNRTSMRLVQPLEALREAPTPLNHALA